jgi:hypothetical protein
MYIRLPRSIASLALGLGAVALGMPLAAQERPAAAVLPAAHDAAATGTALVTLSPLQRQMALSARRGADWLCRSNGPDGHFVHGQVPALKCPLEGDHYLRQAGAALALARAARFTKDERHTAVARQAVLTLLLDTVVDPQQPRVRRPSLPAAIVNPLGAAGLLVLAINELPDPGDDLLEQSEQLCYFIGMHQQQDGSLSAREGPDVTPPADSDSAGHYPGEALYGLMVSQRYRPVAWKANTLRKALGYYQGWCRAHRNPTAVAWHAAAFAEAYVVTGEKPFADCVYELADWVMTVQHSRLDPRHPLWLGGFMTASDGRAIAEEPQIASAACAEALAHACRVARRAGDLSRYGRYLGAVEQGLQFVTTLQYGEANTQHFADWYRPVLLGGFHASQQDGNLRIDYTQQAVCALVAYLEATAN